MAAGPSRTARLVGIPIPCPSEFQPMSATGDSMFLERRVAASQPVDSAGLIGLGRRRSGRPAGTRGWAAPSGLLFPLHFLLSLSSFWFLFSFLSFFLFFLFGFSTNISSSHCTLFSFFFSFPSSLILFLISYLLLFAFLAGIIIIFLSPSSSSFFCYFFLPLCLLHPHFLSLFVVFPPLISSLHFFLYSLSFFSNSFH